jgi:hypothetical protein
MCLLLEVQAQDIDSDQNEKMLIYLAQVKFNTCHSCISI